MPKKSPWYSAKATDPKVYHNNSACTEGDNIQPEYKRDGTDGRPLCKRCKELNDQGK